MLNAPLYVLLVLLGKRGHRYVSSGKIDALSVAKRASDDYPAGNIIAIDGLNLKVKRTVINENALTGRYFFCEELVVHPNSFGRSLECLIT